MFSRRQFINLIFFTISFVSTNEISWGQDTLFPLVTATSNQIGVTTIYNGSYTKIPFPNGNVDKDRSVCTDIIIHMYRDSLGYDLQKTSMLI